eukprot:6179338-Pleurochrysis_carterae.AAC.2
MKDSMLRYLEVTANGLDTHAAAWRAAPTAAWVHARIHACALSHEVPRNNALKDACAKMA